VRPTSRPQAHGSGYEVMASRRNPGSSFGHARGDGADTKPGKRDTVNTTIAVAAVWKRIEVWLSPPRPG